jgi:magnesium transporter
MDTRDQAPATTRSGRESNPPPRSRRGGVPTRDRAPKGDLFREPAPGAPPGTLVIDEAAGGARTRLVLIDYDEHRVEEKDLASIDEAVAYLGDDRPSITWVDVRGICDRATLERMGEVFAIHPLALEDVVNVPQRPKTDVYPNHQLIVARVVSVDEQGAVASGQLGIVVGKDFVLTVQEDPAHDVLEPVRDRIRRGRGTIRSEGSDHLAYSLLDAVIDGFYPVLEAFGERLDDLELEAAEAPRGMSRRIHDVKRQLLTTRRAIWPQRDLLNALLRDESPHFRRETRVYLRDTYDHAVQVMDMVETFREIASGLMDLYLSGVSNRMNETMKVLTVISTIFLPLTFIAGVYGMNFKSESSPWNMPELGWRYGYPFALALMVVSVAALMAFYRHKGWIGRPAAPCDEARRRR